jgi:catechol 2,3-dioxygenase-like lactoylglutathione lyase family enzyme
MASMTRYLHTMYRITDPEASRRFYEALGLEFRDMDIVRNGETEATNPPGGRCVYRATSLVRVLVDAYAVRIASDD